ncbi:MAG: hypothetical protein Q9175_004591 [Cornicularia normoerica]
MLLSYFYVKKVVELLALEMVARDKYGEVEFELKDDGEEIGEGFVRLTQILGKGTSVVASETRTIKRWGDLSARSVSRKMNAVSREMSEPIDTDVFWEAVKFIRHSLQQYLPRSVSSQKTLQMDTMRSPTQQSSWHLECKSSHPALYYAVRLYCNEDTQFRARQTVMGLWTLSPFVGEADENVGVRRVIAVAWFIVCEYAQSVEEEEEKIAVRPAMMVGLGAQISSWYHYVQKRFA